MSSPRAADIAWNALFAASKSLTFIASSRVFSAFFTSSSSRFCSTSTSFSIDSRMRPISSSYFFNRVLIAAVESSFFGSSFLASSFLGGSVLGSAFFS